MASVDKLINMLCRMGSMQPSNYYSWVAYDSEGTYFIMHNYYSKLDVSFGTQVLYQSKRHV